MTAFTLIYTDGGNVPPAQMSVEQAADLLSGFDVIFLGEMHRHPGNHLAQMMLFRVIHERAPDLALSMEQIERDVQPIVDDYLAGRIGEGPFIEQTRAWGNYRTSYRPLVEYAKDHGLPVIAANAPGDVVRCVGLEGPEFLDRMNPEQRAWVAKELHYGEGAYRDKFMGFIMGDAAHGG
ncbi:MAG: ChaN family lipoprotein, partial [Rhodospirillaceae bacterium]